MLVKGQHGLPLFRLRKAMKKYMRAIRVLVGVPVQVIGVGVYWVGDLIEWFGQWIEGESQIL